MSTRCVHLSFFVCFWTYLFAWAKFRNNAEELDTGRPSEHFGRGLGAIRALWSAWQALNVFFPAGVDKTISRGFCMRPYSFSYVRTSYIFFSCLLGTQPGAHTTESSTMQRACLPLADYTKLQPCRPAAAAGSTMRMWQVRAVRWLVALVGACDRSPDHTTTTSPSLLAACCMIMYHTTQHWCQCNSDNRQQQHSSQQYIPASICCSLLSSWAQAPNAPRTCYCWLSMLWCYVLRRNKSSLPSIFSFFLLRTDRRVPRMICTYK